jgi:hypothetical protein
MQAHGDVLSVDAKRTAQRISVGRPIAAIHAWLLLTKNGCVVIQIRITETLEREYVMGAEVITTHTKRRKSSAAYLAL